MSRILVVDDEPHIAALLSATLRLIGYEVDTATTGAQALGKADEFGPELVVLDLMLPDLDGREVARLLRAEHPALPVLFLTARDSIAGLTAGGDEYVTKPFSLETVVGRIRAALRRTARTAGSDGATAERGLLRYADLELDEDAHEVRRAGRLVDLSPTEFNLLRYLLTNAGRVVSKAQILDRVWAYDFGGDVRIVESYVYYLRRKIDRWGPPLIHTVRGVGYALRMPRGAE